MVEVECSGRASFYRAAALDFDGTLSSGGPPGADVTEALATARRAGLRIILVTGRIFRELEEVWPEVLSSVDAVVAENGAVLVTTANHRLLTAPVNDTLDTALREAGIGFRRGEVLLAAKAADESGLLSCVRNLGLGCQTVANRGELMVLPAGITKGTGLYHGLGELGLSYHNTLAVGDAENDHSLLDMSELGVAVGDAVEALKSRADLVLEGPDGAPVADLLTGDLISGRRVVHSDRWQVTVGTTDGGGIVRLPSSQINLLIAGQTGAGKSYVAGHLGEALVEQGYSILVVDPEGDHIGLGRLHGVLVVGGPLPLPRPDEVLRLLHHRYASVVVDLSGLEGADAADYQAALLTRVEAYRRTTGLPHWVFLDEADELLGRGQGSQRGFEPVEKGYCLITWRADDLSVDAVAAMDAVVALGSADPDEITVNLVASIGSLTRAEVARRLVSARGQAVLARRDRPGRIEAFTPARRTTSHLRHIHKYEQRPLDHIRRFHFRRNSAQLTGAQAGNLAELEDELARCDRAVVAHHCPRGDFSRWVTEVFHDPQLGRVIGEVERTVKESSPAADLEEARLGLIRALEGRLSGEVT